MRKQLAIAVLLILGLCGNVFAATTSFTATINGAQANAGAGTGSPATGSATMTYDDATNLFSWSITWTGLTGDITVAHFHGPAMADQNAGVQVDIGAISGLTSPSAGSTTITPAQAQDLLDELWYINIHSTVNPGGEIRGQVLVDPSVPVQDETWTSIKSLFRK